VARPDDSKQVKADVKKLAKKRDKRAKKLFAPSEKQMFKHFLSNIKEKFFG
jgi:hypothetical protein